MTPNIRYIKRDIESRILSKFNKSKIIVIYGARQTGKTTLVKNLFAQNHLPYSYFLCEETRIAEQLVPDSLALKRLIGDSRNIILDEAHKLSNPGLVLKILIDNFPHLNIIASGSSSFDLANKLSEPLTGRHFQFQMFPLTYKEIKNITPPQDLASTAQNMLIYGSYPDSHNLTSNTEKAEYLRPVTDDYLYKDILAFNLVKNSLKVRELLQTVALQIGSEVSYNNLASTLSIDRKTVERLLDLLEKSFVIFRLYGFSRNLRSEINRKIKILFWDLGIRNALINNFNPPNLRPDMGAVFENYAISEVVKADTNSGLSSNFYFWRTYQGHEIDLVRENQGKLAAFEFKLKTAGRTTAFTQFQKAYPGAKTILVTPETLPDILTLDP